MEEDLCGWWCRARPLLWIALYQLNLRWWNWVVFDAVGFDPETHLGASAHFFFYDITKIALLFTGVIPANGAAGATSRRPGA